MSFMSHGTKRELFLKPVDRAGQAYRNVYWARRVETKKIKRFSEKLWERYEEYADRHFRAEIQRNFHARFWEMYLTCTFLEAGYLVRCKKPGPDVLIEEGEGRIWLEAVVPSGGTRGKPDTVRESTDGGVHSIPDEKILLRYRSAIDEKVRKRELYLVKGIVAADDSYVVALNGCDVPYGWAEPPWPRVLGAVYPLGSLEIVINTSSMEIVEERHQYRAKITKSTGAEVPTSIFLDKSYSGLSGLIFSAANAHTAAVLYDQTGRLGEDLIYIHNHVASRPIPSCFLPVRAEYSLFETQVSYRILSKTCIRRQVRDGNGRHE